MVYSYSSGFVPETEYCGVTLMESGKTVSHDGEVVVAEKGNYQVKIVTKSACSGCHSSKYCSVADVKEKIVEVFSEQEFSVGENVLIKLEEKKGLFAVLIGFVIPLVLLVMGVGFMVSNGFSETAAAATSLGGVTLYYLLLWSQQGRMKKEFSFKIEKKNTN